MADKVQGITSTLSFFAQSFDKGRVALLEDAQSIFHLLIIVEVIFAGIYFAIGQGAELRSVAKKLLIIGFFSFVISNYSSLLDTVLAGFIYAGQKASGETGADLSLFKDPGHIFTLGCQKIKPAFDKLLEMGMLDLISLDPLVVLFGGIVSCLCFGLLAIQMFVTYLEYLVVSALGFILIPFGIFEPLRFLADRVFGAIIGFGIKFMCLGLIIGAAEQYVGQLILPAAVTWQQSLDFVVVALALCFLGFHAPGLALTLLTGSPHISAGSVAATAAGAAVLGGRLAEAQSTGLTSMGSVAMSTAGAAMGGAIPAAQALSPKGISGGPLSKAATIASKGALGALGAASGVLSGAASAMGEHLMHGKNGSPTGSKATRADLGLNPAQGGIKGAVQRGLFSVPQYRDHAKKKDTEKRKEDKQPGVKD